MTTLHFQGGLTSSIEITKQGRKWTYFTAKTNACKYRVNNVTGEVQMAPYWIIVKDMYLS